MTGMKGRGRGRRPVRRTLAAVVAVPALLLPLAACGGGDGGDGGGKGASSEDGKQGQDKGSGKNGDGGDDGKGGSGASAKPLSEKELRSALVTGKEVAGYQVHPTKDALEGDDKNTPRTSAQCRPLVDIFSADSRQKRSDWAAEGLLKGKKGQFNTQSTVHQVLLAAYEGDDATTFVKDVKSAAGSCKQIVGPEDGKGGKSEKVTVESRPSPGRGDDSVQFALKNSEGRKAGVVVTVVRSGANTMSFMSSSLSGKQVEEPKPVVDKQVAKLEAAARG